MAARGSMPDDFGTDWILRDLVGSDAFREPRAREVLIRFASCLGPARLSVQDAVGTHLEAVRGCARFCDVLPSLDVERSESADLHAWRCIDELLFELEREHVGDRRTRPAVDLWSAILGDLTHAAVDVIYQVHRAAEMVDDSNSTVYGRLVATYRDEVRKLLEWGLVHRDQLTSYFGSSQDWERADRDKYIVRTLGVVGDASTAVTLRGYTGDPTLGEAAVAAIWQIERANTVPTR
jgi:hypothetical protein